MLQMKGYYYKCIITILSKVWNFVQSMIIQLFLASQRIYRESINRKLRAGSCQFFLGPFVRERMSFGLPAIRKQNLNSLVRRLISSHETKKSVPWDEFICLVRWICPFREMNLSILRVYRYMLENQFVQPSINKKQVSHNTRFSTNNLLINT